MENYSFKLEKFEGPMELLMHLIDKNKIDVYDIPISSLTGQYMDYLAHLRDFNIDIVSSFLVMAATLLQIKSRLMLPQIVKEDNPYSSEEDPRQELVNRILEYRKFKQIALRLENMRIQQSQAIVRSPMLLPMVILPPTVISISRLKKSFQTILLAEKERHTVSQPVNLEKYKISDIIEKILYNLSHKKGNIKFQDFCISLDKDILVVSFLAMLELIRQNIITVEQPRNFGEISLFLCEAVDG